MTELGPDNELLYNLYAQMSDVVVFVLDSNNTGSISEVSMKIRDQISEQGGKSEKLLCDYSYLHAVVGRYMPKLTNHMFSYSLVTVALTLEDKNFRTVNANRLQRPLKARHCMLKI